MGQKNWEYVVSQGASSLSEYCESHKLLGEAGAPVEETIGVFDPKSNPLVCARTEAEAKAAYGLIVQTASRKQSMRTTFIFIGVWLLILLSALGIQKVLSKRAEKTKD